jgi:Zn-dependent protease with chaperone function
VNDEGEIAKIRQLFLKARILRFLSLLFFVTGCLTFVIYYERELDGDVSLALRYPFFAAFLLFSFLPAIVLRLWSNKIGKKAVAAFRTLKEQDVHEYPHSKTN